MVRVYTQLNIKNISVFVMYYLKAISKKTLFYPRFPRQCPPTPPHPPHSPSTEKNHTSSVHSFLLCDRLLELTKGYESSSGSESAFFLAHFYLAAHTSAQCSSLVAGVEHHGFNRQGLQICALSCSLDLLPHSSLTCTFCSSSLTHTTLPM